MEELSNKQFLYDLPDERIARFPLAVRDQSKLLVYQGGKISHERFYALAEWVPPHSYLVFNNTKVIPARLLFSRATGAVIELFLLNPVPADRSMSEAMQDTATTVWQCMIGNRKRWKDDEVLQMQIPAGDRTIVLSAAREHKEDSLIRFSWQPAEESFAHVIQLAGQMPLPPYLKRDATRADDDTYQTVYSKEEGAVAAPTAGLHFTDRVFADLAEKNIGHDFLTLHVGAGTFQPIKTDNVREHQMHVEQVVYTRQNVEHFIAHAGHLLPVGTTSMRSLESLYWMGVKLIRQDTDPFRLDQHYAYSVPEPERPAPVQALGAVLTYMDKAHKEQVIAHTGIYIMPGYRFMMCRGIITNFHQPNSTLILLVAALLGEGWRTVYDEALANDYRFLSYGDSSLLLP
ncbi:S-adenosylmethionine:tRNA ribosyltransferase-isomerase [Arsenicibacter rosenii]|uniref:S-adenosylmethionine tRNA ribosyltransferase n=1 Tax=Arsenicibacter rosenii TaxID=1750698 RepID=A0A1S2VFH8_9BACT|nr:S-adenosylmethionine:tRNA ribosyltransferase-isomerase [Arsenicibacter rosenii]OIN56966.1 S-adenosylmethionine tRNA ribosyltransferase [Arsenicibacter rosenii]